MQADTQQPPSLNGNRPDALRTAEMVGRGHPDKFCDQVADELLDRCLAQDPGTRAGIEALAKDGLLDLSGEVTTTADVDVEAAARRVYAESGYGAGRELSVLNRLKQQSPEIAVGAGTSGDGGVDFGGAGDQGIMVGYATLETPERMPVEYVLARRLCHRLEELESELDWLRSDTKSQVTVAGERVQSVVLAAQHDPSVSTEEVRATLLERVVEPVVGNEVERVVINGTGRFTIGGPLADAGVVGRKIVVDAYGPRIAVGGGAYSGKDPSKVDRSAAYMARNIAKSIVEHQVGGASQAHVTLAFAIGQEQPEMVAAVTDTGEDVKEWVHTHFADLRPRAIIERLGLLAPDGWSYRATSVLGHYGRPEFPWEQVPGL